MPPVENLDTTVDSAATAAAPAVETPPVDDVFADTRAALESLRSDQASPDLDPKDGAATELKPTDAAPSQTDAQPRAPDGKFATKDAAPAKAAPEVKPAAALQQAKEVPAQDDQTKVTATASTPSGNPPAGWAADAKADWSKLSPAVQAAVVKREAEIDAGGRQWSEQRRAYEQLISPLLQETERLRIPPQEGLNRLLAANDALNRDPVAAITWLMQSYGVNLEQLSSAPAPQPQPRVDPMVATLSSKLESLERVIADTRTQPIVAAVQDFSSKQPHWATVENDVLALIPIIQAQQPGATPQAVLEAAYDRACWQNPDVRTRLLSERDTAAQAERAQTVQTKHSQARRASISIPRSPSGPPPQRNGATSGDVFDDVRAAIDQHRTAV